MGKEQIEEAVQKSIQKMEAHAQEVGGLAFATQKLRPGEAARWWRCGYANSDVIRKSAPSLEHEALSDAVAYQWPAAFRQRVIAELEGCGKLREARCLKLIDTNARIHQVLHSKEAGPLIFRKVYGPDGRGIALGARMEKGMQKSAIMAAAKCLPSRKEMEACTDVGRRVSEDLLLFSKQLAAEKATAKILSVLKEEGL